MGIFKKPSWKRTLGITNARRKIAKATGIPTTRAGRQQKLGRTVAKGCAGKAALLLFGLIALCAAASVVGCRL